MVLSAYALHCIPQDQVQVKQRYKYHIDKFGNIIITSRNDRKHLYSLCKIAYFASAMHLKNFELSNKFRFRQPLCLFVRKFTQQPTYFMLKAIIISV